MQSSDAGDLGLGQGRQGNEDNLQAVGRVAQRNGAERRHQGGWLLAGVQIQNGAGPCR